MKQLILFNILLLVGNGYINAQTNLENKTPEERAKMQTEWMKQNLELDSVTTDLAHEINLKYANKVEAFKNKKGNRFAKISEARAIINKKEQELKKIFTESQYDFYLKKKEEVKKRRKRAQ